MNPETYDYIYATYQGGKVREYYKSLAVLDRSIEGINVNINDTLCAISIYCNLAVIPFETNQF